MIEFISWMLVPFLVLLTPIVFISKWIYCRYTGKPFFWLYSAPVEKLLHKFRKGQ